MVYLMLSWYWPMALNPSKPVGVDFHATIDFLYLVAAMLGRGIAYGPPASNPTSRLFARPRLQRLIKPEPRLEIQPFHNL